MTSRNFAALVWSIEKCFSEDQDAPSYLYVKLYSIILDSHLFYFAFYCSSSVRNYSYIAGGIFNTGRSYFVLGECLCEISDFRRGVTLVGCYMAMLVAGCRHLKGRPVVYPAVSVTNYQPTPPNVPEELKDRSFLSFSGVAKVSVLLGNDAVSLVTCSWLSETKKWSDL